MTRKKIILIVLAALLLTGFSARHQLASLAFEWYLKGYCSSCLDAKLSFDDARYEDGKWVLIHPMLTTKQCLEMGGYRFRAESAIIDANVAWWERIIDLDIVVHEPFLDIGKGLQETKQFLVSAGDKFKFFNVHTHFGVPQGTALIHHFSNEEPSKLFFSVDLACRHCRHGMISLWSEESEKERQECRIKVAETEAQELMFDLHLNDANGAALLYPLKELWALGPDYDFSKGVMNGKISMIFPSDSLPYGSGEISIKDLTAYVPELGAIIELPAIHIVLANQHAEDHQIHTLVDLVVSNDASMLFLHHDQPLLMLKMAGNLSFNSSSPQPIETLNGTIKIDEGKIILGKWEFSHSDSELKIARGIIEKAVFTADIAGLRGTIEVDGRSTQPAINMNFEGQMRELSRVLPACIGEGIDKKFSNDFIRLTTTAVQGEEGLRFQGQAFINDDKVDFGFSTESFDLKNGWFKAEKLSLDKYLAPFIFQQDQMSLGGKGDFQGIFDEKTVTIHYQAFGLTLENEDFLIEIKNSDESHSHPHVEASHVINLTNQTGAGVLPICNATYFEKNSGLLFTDINTKIHLEHTKLQASELKAFCKGIYFSGAADVDWSMPGEGKFEVGFHIKEMAGKMSQVQHFFSHFKQPLFFFKLPMEGNVAFHRHGGNIRFAFQPDDYQLDAHLEGVLTDGTMPCENTNIRFHEISLNFEYDHKAHLLNFSEIQGSLLVGTTSHFEEYSLAGDQIRFTDPAYNESQFDVWIGDKNRDIIRLVGKTTALPSIQDETLINVELDRSQTHFGDVHPKAFRMILKDWSQINTFQLGFEFHLKTLLHDLQRFSRTGLFFLSRSLLRDLNEIKVAEGDFKANLDFDGNRSLFTYDISADHVVIGSHQFKQIVLNGNKKGELWSIEQLRLDDISFAADFFKEADLWNINFLGARFGKSLLLGLEGKYDAEKSFLDAKINLLDMDLGQLMEWPVLRHFLDNLNLHGQVKAHGKIAVDFTKPSLKGMKVNLDLKGSLSNGKIKDFFFEDIDNMSFHYASDREFFFSGVQTTLKSSDHHEYVKLFLEKIGLNFTHREMVMQGLAFELPVNNLRWVAEKLRESMPSTFSLDAVDMISGVKSEGKIVGSLCTSISERHFNVQLHLDDGQYRFFGKDYDLRDLHIVYDPFGMKIFNKCFFQRKNLQLEVHVAPGFNQGECIVSNGESNEMSHHSPLTIHWQTDPSTGYFINKISGIICGVSCELTRNELYPLSKQHLFLTGKVQLDILQAQPLLEKELAAKLMAWEIGSGCWLQGTWSVNKDPLKTLIDCIEFQGELLGHEFDFYGFRFNSLRADLTYNPQQIKAMNVFITDGCGALQSHEMTLVFQQDGKWQATVPNLSITQFRPALLRTTKLSNSPSMGKALVFRQIDLHHFQGVMGDRNSFRGSGNLVFANPPKNNLQHTIFAIPAEILNRIGLDLAVLNPVRGNIEYKISDGRVNLMRFKDVYSKGRISKFYLAQNGNPSYLDFDGNINMQIRMKQYNLIFKLAELFTFTVQGTLNKPTYTLQKQTKQPKRAES